MTRRLPPIFAKHRFKVPKDRQPNILFCVTPEMDREADEAVREMDERDTIIDHFSAWWVEYKDAAVLAQIVGDTEYRLQCFNRRSGVDAPFVLNTDMLTAEVWPLSDMQKISAALYIRAAILLRIYTEREREVSVNTLTRNTPRAFQRQGDSLKFAPLESLASVAGQSRQRGYVRPFQASGIQMREHDVRGHWRTYASGVRVWVRPHKRGDADLGRVQRVIT